MPSIFFRRLARALFEVLFIRVCSDNIRKLKWGERILIYTTAFTLFYLPIFYFAIRKCLEDSELIIYFAIIAMIHILAKVMLCSSKKIQQRFATIKRKKHFFIRTFLIAEYVVFMWLVYLIYPFTCIFVPFSLISMSFESLLGHSLIFGLFSQNPEKFIFFGGVVSYVIFIIADGYKKLRTGFLPDYLGLYAVLTVVSASLEGASKRFVEYFTIDANLWTTTLSRIFSLSNDSMNIVASVMTFFFAIHSLYTNRGMDVTEDEKN